MVTKLIPDSGAGAPVVPDTLVCGTRTDARGNGVVERTPATFCTSAPVSLDDRLRDGLQAGEKARAMHQLFEIYAQAGVFDAEEVCILTAAFDETWQAVQDSGGPFASNGEAEAIRDLIALRIIAMARLGKVHCGRLRYGALPYLARMKGTTAENPGVT